MFVVFLRFSALKSEAPRLMPAHNDWIRRGFDDGVFLTVGALQPSAGGAVLAHGLSREALEALLAEDPFVAEGVVEPEIFEISASRADARLDFLVA